jgi:anthranilate/para-aminobenzoate synthase component II
VRPIWLIDFDDSFTHNIASEFYLLGFPCRVISWRNWNAPEAELPGLLVLGPGPGHPDDYGIETHMMSWWKSGVPIVGICLGHQMIARFLGLPVVRAKHPCHGETVDLITPEDWRKRLNLPRQIQVQRYNSLAVKQRQLPRGWQGWAHEGEWLAFRHKRVISYQFHPESVGTSCPEKFFRPLCELAL